jgi:hypothetical protein
MLLGVVVVLGHPVILLSCLIGVVLFLSWIPVSGLSNDKGQRREPATGDVRIATRRAGWRPFAGPTGWPPNEGDLAARNAEDARTEPPPHR